ncbi:TPA: transcriptional regulator [Klebsiella oxytoca]|nr:transcriptional regulator [Klebsiella oxytoca]
MLFIVLTDNSWLSQGISALLPDMLCQQMEFSSQCISLEASNASRVVILVDSLIFLRGEWIAFSVLCRMRPDANIVWLKRKNTGAVFPSKSNGEIIVQQNLNLNSLRLVLLRASKWATFRGDGDYVKATKLTLVERRLLPFMASGMSIHSLSRLTGKPIKTLYTHRNKILKKTGFRQMAFLQFVYEHNRDLFMTQGL